MWIKPPDGGPSFRMKMADPFTRHPQNQPIRPRRITAAIDIIRHGRPVPVRVTHKIEFDGSSWGWGAVRVTFPGTRRRYRLSYREEDRAAFVALAAVA